MSSDWDEFFRAGSVSDDHPNGFESRAYQTRLAKGEWPQTLVIPTGFGKTAAVLSSWLWKRAAGDRATPTRLVYCLPMRTLVEQTERVANCWVAAAWSGLGLKVSVDVLMGGAEAGQRRGVPGWMMQADKPAILIGTQDMLVSAALMRGYGVTRYRWPVDFALLHNDAMWVFDEVQLAGAALPTSAQLEAFRKEYNTAAPARTLWMSATLDPAWLKTVDFTTADQARPHDLSDEDLSQTTHLWKAVKALRRAEISPGEIAGKLGPARDKAIGRYATALAHLARKRSQPGRRTIVFLNTVARAQAVFTALKATADPATPLLLHSRFRQEERARITEEALKEPPEGGCIVVTTQALEAGVDMTSSVMVTELAPWSSMVQRFGRCNRYGECGEKGGDVLWVDLPDEAAQPYSAEELGEARGKLSELMACGPAALSAVRLSSPPATHVIRRRDLLDLFDTEADLSGFDLDVSPYVRDAHDTDVRLFWREVPEKGEPPADAPAASRDELCPAPHAGAKALLGRKGVRGWRWDTLDRAWLLVAENDLRPGMTVMLDAGSGGYDPAHGFDPAATMRVPVVQSAAETPGAMDDEKDSESKVRISLARHTARVRAKMAELCDQFDIVGAERAALMEAAKWHDLGKAHEAFVAFTRRGVPHAAHSLPLLAKWPKAPKGTKQAAGERRGFRHELASALGYLAIRNWHRDADLSAYLIAAHHGKVRMRLAALPGETAAPDGRLFARRVWDGDVLPPTQLDEDFLTLELTLDLDIMQLGDGPHGASWSARSLALLRTWGPFRLAYLEALLRIADWRASDEEVEARLDDL